MTIGSVIMIICAALYGLVIILFKDKNQKNLSNEKQLVENDPFVCTDGTPGADGLLSSDFDRIPSD